MPIKPGTYLGGIRDEQSLMDRCRVDEDTGCWRWALSCCQGSPHLQLILPDGTKRVMRGRRAALIIATGKDIPPGVRAFPKPECHWHDCVRPSHTQGGTASEASKAASARGAFDTIPHRANLHAIQQRKRKLTPEQQRQVAEGTGCVKADAARFGISLSRVRTLRRGDTRQQLRPRSAFEWRP
jgi:hypothetical protein